MITLEKAKKAIEASEKKAGELGVTVSTVITDDHGDIIAISRMDGALSISPKFALGKAFGSANLGVPSDTIAQYAAEGKPYFGVNTLFGGEINVLAGGLPVHANGQRIGGIGVGGSMDTNQDKMCAQAALDVLNAQ
jgi:uncharacterized protein GlcG (DUF336 family)